MIEAVEAEGGNRPARADVAEYLKAQADSIVGALQIKTAKPLAPPLDSVSKVSSSSPHGAKGIGYQFQGDAWQSFKNGKQVYLAILIELSKKYPDFPQRYKKAKTKGKREWVARTGEELFPGKPELQQSEVTDIGGGWLAGTNISAQSDMPKRIQAACACVGLVFGRNLVATFL